MVNHGLGYIFQGGRLSTSAGTEIEHNENLGNVYTILRLLTQKDGDLSSYFDKIDETQAGITNSTLKHLLIDSHNNEDNKGRIRANLPLDYIFGFCRTFLKNNERLRIRTSIEIVKRKTKYYIQNPRR